MSRSQADLALSGEVDGLKRSFLLGPGVNRLGSRPGRGVVLAARGVSKRHALLVVEENRVTVEDLASKNGTFVAGQRIDSAIIEPGARLRFGPVELQLSALPEKSSLAIELPAMERPPTGPSVDINPTASSTATPGPETPFFQGELGSYACLSALQAFIARLPARTGNPSLSGAFEGLAEALDAEGAALVLSGDEGAGILSASTPMPRELVAALHDRPTHRRRSDPEALNLAYDRDRVWVASRPAEGGRSLVLVVWGGPPQLPDALSTAILDLVSQCDPTADSLPTRPRGGLELPGGLVRCPSLPMKRLYRQMAAVASSGLPVLILGETGVGKEGVAATIHRSSPRNDRPFVAVNCAAIPEDLLEAELFGIGRGVATGVMERLGKFREADGGTLFLDEIGEMSPQLQAKLLRALQEKEVTPVGGSPIAIDVRIIAATNCQLDQQLDSGSFRHDLYYRLAGCVLRIPPLAERREDIPALVEAFLRSTVAEHGRAVRGLTHSALELLVESPWPGNIRQLEHSVRRLAFLAADAQVIDAELVRDTVHGGSASGHRGGVLPLPTLNLSELESRAIEEALNRCDGHQTQAAELLGITRTSLYRRLSRES